MTDKTQKKVFAIAILGLLIGMYASAEIANISNITNITNITNISIFNDSFFHKHILKSNETQLSDSPHSTYNTNITYQSGNPPIIFYINESLMGSIEFNWSVENQGGWFWSLWSLIANDEEIGTCEIYHTPLQYCSIIINDSFFNNGTKIELLGYTNTTPLYRISKVYDFMINYTRYEDNFNNLNNQVSNINNDIIEINNTINSLNDTVNNIKVPIILENDVISTSTSLYQYIFNITIPANKNNLISIYLMQNVSESGLTPQNRAQVDNNNIKGYCSFRTMTSASAESIDNIDLSTSSVDTDERSGIFLSPVVNTIQCSIIGNAVDGELQISFQNDASGTIKTNKGSYYTIVEI